MTNETGIQLLKLLKRWVSGSIDKFAEEMHIPPQDVEIAAQELFKEGLIESFSMDDNTMFNNKMLEINRAGLAYIDAINGNVDTII